MLGLQLLVAVLGALAVILALNNRNLRATINNNHEIAERRIQTKDKQLNDYKMTIDDTDLKIAQVRTEERKKTEAAQNEVKQLQAKIQEKDAEINKLKESLTKAEAREKDLKAVLEKTKEFYMKKEMEKAKTTTKQKKGKEEEEEEEEEEKE